MSDRKRAIKKHHRWSGFFQYLLFTAVIISFISACSVTDSLGITSADKEDSPYWMLLLAKSGDSKSPTITYVSDRYSFWEGSSIAETTPTVSATPLTNCTSSPTLPDGLSIDSSTCMISGTPTAIQDATDFTITASNSYGTGSTRISIEILPPGSSPSSGPVSGSGGAPALSYTTAPYIFTRNSVITTVVPSSGGGPFSNCVASPALPSGLSLSATSCAISGSPTTTQGPTGYMITAKNSRGSGSTHISISIVSAGLPPALSYESSSYVFSRNIAITTIVPSLGGNAPFSCTATPALPAGLSLNNTSCAISGTPTSVQNSAVYTITATNQYGSTAVNVSIGVKESGTAPEMSFPDSPYTYSQDGNVRVKPILGGSSPTGCSASPSLPDGLYINPTSCAIFGTALVQQSLTYYTITATNDFGNGTTVAGIEINPGQPPQITYSNAVNSYAVNNTIPTLYPTSSTGGAPSACAVSPALPGGLFIDTSTCAISGTPTVRQLPTSYTITPSNKYGVGVPQTVQIQVLDPINAALTNLNVDIDPPPLEDKNGDPLPPNYNPLMRPTAAFGKISELVGWGPASSTTNILNGVYENIGTTNQGYNPTPLGIYGHSSPAITNTIKGGVAGDFDGDGYDETALIYVDNTNGNIRFSTRDGKNGSYGVMAATQTVGTTPYYSTTGNRPGMIDVTAGDIDGDGKDEVIIAVGIRSFQSVAGYNPNNPDDWTPSATGSVKLIVLDDGSVGFAKLGEYIVDGSGRDTSIYVNARDVTGDGKAEIAVCYTKIDTVGASPQTAQAFFLIYDYSGGTMPYRAFGAVKAKDTDGTVYKPMLADVTSGDVNRDGVPEFIFAGVEYPSSANSNMHYDLISVQYNGSEYVELTASTRRITDNISGDWTKGANSYSEDCGSTQSCDYILPLDVFAETLDTDGDGRVELLVNNRVYDYAFEVMKDRNGKDMNIWGLMNNNNTAVGSNNPLREFNRSNTWITVGDFNGDHRGDIAYWGRSRSGNIPVWGVDENGAFGQMGWYNTSKLYDDGDAGQDDVRGNYPVLFAANTDDDSLVLSYDHTDVSFTEPIPQTVLSAAPCYSDVTQNLMVPNQNLASCSSQFGSSSTSGNGFTASANVSAAVRAGGRFGKADVWAVQIQVEGEYHHEWSHGHEASTTKGIAYTSGTNEDSVIFSSLPLDIYIYKILAVPSDNTDPDVFVGADYPVMIPRAPVVQMAELSYYNQMVAPINPNRVIGSETFQHTPGNPWSYPTSSQRDTILSENGCITSVGVDRSNANFTKQEYCVTYDGGSLMSDEAAVGEGTGFNEISISYDDIFTVSDSNGFNVTVSVDTDIGSPAGGFVGGASFGFGYDGDVTTSSGTEFSYSGTVGALDAASYASDRYRYGMFLYQEKNHPSGLKFNVLNYWVSGP